MNIFFLTVSLILNETSWKGPKILQDLASTIFNREVMHWFYFTRSKGYQEGKNYNNTWNIYSNPFEPHLCPVIALLNYLFSNPDFLSNIASIFTSG